MTAQQPAPMVRAGPLDDRVTSADGSPVRFRQAASGPPGRNGGWWFRVRRSPGRDGVELVARIPHVLDKVTRHATQEDADAAAAVAYGEYADAAGAARSGAPSATEEAS